MAGKRELEKEGSTPPSVYQKADPILLDILEKHDRDDETIDVACVLKHRADRPIEPDDAVKITEKVLHNVEKVVGGGPARFNVLRNIGSFIVSAKPEFVRQLLLQDEIDSAMANEQPDMKKY